MTTQDGYDWPTPHEQPPVLAQPMAPYFREQLQEGIAIVGPETRMVVDGAVLDGMREFVRRHGRAA